MGADEISFEKAGSFQKGRWNRIFFLHECRLENNIVS